MTTVSFFAPTTIAITIGIIIISEWLDLSELSILMLIAANFIIVTVIAITIDRRLHN